MNDAIIQGGSDMNINMIFNSTANEGLTTQQDISLRMQELIEEQCGGSDPVNAILVSLPNENIVQALQSCQANDIPVATFNAGPDIAKANDLLFYGQNETTSGFLAGYALANVVTTEKFCCANHARGVDVLAERCGGMEAGVQSLGKGNVFDVTVDPNDCDAWENAIISGGCSPDEGKGWETIGVYMAGMANHKCGVQFLEKYPATYADASDISLDLFAGMEAGLNILFGSDQQSYLQGYLPFSSLTLAVTNDQIFENKMISTGPKLVTSPPSAHDQECKDNNFAVCERTDSVPLISVPSAPVVTPVGPPDDSVPSVTPVDSPAIPSGTSLDPPAPSPDATAGPLSRALSQITADYSYHITLAFGGIILAVGGMILAN
ncbi:hypothetical protein ACHAWT_006365 [Skeletonema menzelii]